MTPHDNITNKTPTFIIPRGSPLVIDFVHLFIFDDSINLYLFNCPFSISSLINCLKNLLYGELFLMATEESHNG